MLSFLSLILDALGLILNAVDLILCLRDWRFSLCLFGSIALSALAVSVIPYFPLGCAMAAAIVIAGMVVGWRWNRDHS